MRKQLYTRTISIDARSLSQTCILNACEEVFQSLQHLDGHVARHQQTAQARVLRQQDLRVHTCSTCNGGTEWVWPSSPQYHTYGDSLLLAARQTSRHFLWPAEGSAMSTDTTHTPCLPLSVNELPSGSCQVRSLLTRTIHSYWDSLKTGRIATTPQHTLAHTKQTHIVPHLMRILQCRVHLSTALLEHLLLNTRITCVPRR